MRQIALTLLKLTDHEDGEFLCESKMATYYIWFKMMKKSNHYRKA
jgi:hypothetical protein